MLTEDLSLIIPWCNRESLKSTLPHNLSILEATRCSIVLVNCGGDPETIFTYIPPSLKRVLLVTLRQPFNKCLSINIGLAVTQTNLLSVLDADIVLTPGYLESVARALNDSPCFTIASSVLESKPSTAFPRFKNVIDIERNNRLDFRFRGGKEIRLPTFHASLLTGTRGGPGLLGVRCNDLKAIGGFNSRLTHWGWEDQDIQLRLIYSLELERKEVGIVQHLTHPDRVRTLGGLTREQANIINMCKCLKSYENNDFQGTYHHDVTSDYNVLAL